MYGFDPETDVFRFYGVFWYPNNLVTNCEGTKGTLLYMGPKFRPFWVACFVMK